MTTNGSTRSFATKILVLTFSLCFFVMTGLLVYCTVAGKELPTEIYMAFLTATTSNVSSIVAFYFLSKKRLDEEEPVPAPPTQ